VGVEFVVVRLAYRFATRDARSHLMHAFSKIQPPHSIMDDIPHNDRIELAIANLETQECLNNTATARKYKIERITLSRRHRGVTGSKKDQYSYTAKTLTNVQKDVLIQYINDLNARKFPSILQIIKNLAEELANKELNYNWIGRFVERKKIILKSVYLTTIDYKRKISDNSYYYKYFFTNVRLRFYYIVSVMRVTFVIEFPPI
jgi:hypothetical protein